MERKHTDQKRSVTGSRPDREGLPPSDRGSGPDDGRPSSGMIRPVSLSLGVSAFFTVLVAVAVLRPSTAQAVPSYARQTGLSCNACHTTPPELNSAGRRFKLLGYTDRADDTAAVKNEPGERHAGLDLLKALPVSAMVEASLTSTKKAQPDTERVTTELPQDVSLFLAGGWSKHVGSFVQVTYSKQDDNFSIDNADIRYAQPTKMGGKELVWGLTLNNNPTVEDLWNSTPAWGFPWIESDSAPGPTAAPIIASLGQDVAGLGGYFMWNDHLYFAATAYRSDHVGSPRPESGEGFGVNIRGAAPYGRLAWQQSFGAENYLEIGGYGMYVKSTPNGVTGLEDSYTDWAADLTYDRSLFVRDVLSFRCTYIREKSSLDATLEQGGASRKDHSLDTFQGNVEYNFGNRYSLALGGFDVSGTFDPVLYAPSPVSGSANGSPKSAGYIASASWWPVQNIQIALQYTGYSRFNGASSNYDGSGRDASANNTTYLVTRFVF